MLGAHPIYSAQSSSNFVVGIETISRHALRSNCKQLAALLAEGYGPVNKPILACALLNTHRLVHVVTALSRATPQIICCLLGKTL
jgi:hypothetical protein